MKGRQIIYSNAVNEENPFLRRFPSGARECIEKKIHMKMYDYYKRFSVGRESLNSMDYFGKKYTFGWLNEQIEKYAKALKGYGIEQGDFVSILLPNMPEIVVLKMALNRIGAVSNLIDPRYNPNSILELVNSSQSKIAICVQSKYRTGIKPIKEKLCVEDIFLVDPFESVKIKEIKSKEGFIRNLLYRFVCLVSHLKSYARHIKSTVFKNCNVHDIKDLLKHSVAYKGAIDSPYIKDSPAVVLYTSGTTGGPLKGAIHSNEGYNALHAELEYAFPEEKPGMIFSGLIPIFLSYGSGVCMFNSLVAGFEMVMHPTYNPEDIVNIIERDHPDIVVGVPKFFQMMSDSGKDFDYISHIIIGGDKILPNRIEEFRKRFPQARIAVGYGETEFLGVISVTLSNSERADSSGVPLPGIKLKVIDYESKTEVPFMQKGEAFISGLTQMIEYLNKPEETDKITFYDASSGEVFFSTGDIVRMTPDGELIFLDRIKRLMKRPDGHQVNADTIEKVLSSVKGTKEVCVVGLRYKDKFGVIPTAFIEVSSALNKNNLVKEYEKASVEKLASFRDKALAYVFLDKIPYTPNGKHDVMELAKRKLEDIPDAVIVDRMFMED